MTGAPITASERDQRAEDALAGIKEHMGFWLASPGRVVVSFRMTRHGWTEDWMARYEPDPVCSSCGQTVEDPASAPIS